MKRRGKSIPRIVPDPEVVLQIAEGMRLSQKGVDARFGNEIKKKAGMYSTTEDLLMLLRKKKGGSKEQG